jgi:hypothetical protein
MQICDCNQHGYVVWVTADLSGVRTTTPHLLAPGSEQLNLFMSASGMALCFMVWTRVENGNFQLVVVASVYLQTAEHHIGRTTVHKNGCVRIDGPFINVTASVFEALAVAAEKGRGYVQDTMALEPSISQPAGMLHNGGYIIDTHKDPWFTTFARDQLIWEPVPSSCGYPSVVATVLDATIWGKAVRMAAVLLCHPIHESSVSNDMLNIITVCALTVFAGMYNATPETSDDRKGEFMSLGTNGDCDDMAIACAAAANWLISNEVFSPHQSLAAVCHHWLKSHVSSAVICLGYAVGKVADPTKSVEFGFRPSPAAVYDETTGAGHCWAALLPLTEDPNNRLSGALMLEATRQTFNWPGATPASLAELGFPLCEPYQVYGAPSGYAHTIKPLAPDQYKQVVYIIDAVGSWLVSNAGVFGAPWATATTMKAGGVSTRRIGPVGSALGGLELYRGLEEQFVVPMLHRYDLLSIEAQWLKHRDAWETLTHGAPLHAKGFDQLTEGKPISLMSHVDAGNLAYELGFGVQFGLKF